MSKRDFDSSNKLLKCERNQVIVSRIKPSSRRSNNGLFGNNAMEMGVTSVCKV